MKKTYGYPQTYVDYYSVISMKFTYCLVFVFIYLFIFGILVFVNKAVCVHRYVLCLLLPMIRPGPLLTET